ncbi:hypothetical protein AJ79_05376 [Helicocarpus griseus UAMH5409]|uniref:Protein kinase domain-containing protein n=1 Tax=Helicocarpus griseus UAMH5409 TaxID=1447875 RepID=A0A2B7XPV1_9EURO|nr:hypothetical protein AJ79_05376 [Helicocarpus griseus UAMH5409]
MHNLAIEELAYPEKAIDAQKHLQDLATYPEDPVPLHKQHIYLLAPPTESPLDITTTIHDAINKEIHVPQRPGCIAIGQTGEICKLTDSLVIKHPKSQARRPTTNSAAKFLDTERQIYERLGSHAGILPYFGPHDDTGAIQLAYAQQGDLAAYIQSRSDPSLPPQALRKTWIETLIRAFHHIYSCRVLHQDVKLSNILVHDDVPKVADFANGAIFPTEKDMELVYERDPLSRVDLLGIDCVMYSVATWQVFEYDYFENGR